MSGVDRSSSRPSGLTRGAEPLLSSSGTEWLRSQCTASNRRCWSLWPGDAAQVSRVQTARTMVRLPQVLLSSLSQKSCCSSDFWTQYTMILSADPTANPEPTEPSGELPGTWDQLDGFELGMLLSWNNRAHGSTSSSSDRKDQTSPLEESACVSLRFYTVLWEQAPRVLSYHLGLIPVPFPNPIFLGKLAFPGSFPTP